MQRNNLDCSKQFYNLVRKTFFYFYSSRKVSNAESIEILIKIFMRVDCVEDDDKIELWWRENNLGTIYK